MKSLEESEVFEEYGPTYLEYVDWSILEHQRSVAASLVEGVYVKERDRQKHRTGTKAVAPIWWEFFNFEPVQDLKDIRDGSIFGSIFKYTNPDPIPTQPEIRPPKYVIALRGTFLHWRTLLQDGYLSAKYVLNTTKSNTRYQTTFEAVQDIIVKAGQENVWLTGHSLGAAIALQVGKTMAIEGYHIASYLFNPPYISVPIEKLSSRKLKTGLRVAKTFFTLGALGVYAVFNDFNTPQHYDPFTVLSQWIPYLFVNQNDLICHEYIGYFEYQKKMESWGLGFIPKIVGQNSIKRLFLGAFGAQCKAHHLVPSACIVKNLRPMDDDLAVAHGIEQWWANHTDWYAKRYEYHDN